MVGGRVGGGGGGGFIVSASPSLMPLNYPMLKNYEQISCLI